MGDWFRSLVAPEILAAQARVEGDRLLAWLIAEQIVLAEKTDCVLGGNAGHSPGPQYARVTGTANPRWVSLRSNGLSVVIKRTVFHSGQGGFELVCSVCNSKLDPPDGWSDAVNEWYQGSGPGILACPKCDASRAIVEWKHDPPWAFGEFGFTFWNWPQFTEAFVREFERELGSRVVHVYGKL